MGAIEIPGVGEKLGVEYVRVGSFGGSSDADVAFDTLVLSTGAGVYPIVNIREPGVWIEGIELQVVSRLTTSTGTFIIGDAADPDGYWTDTLLVGTSSGAAFNRSASSVGYAGGKVYTSSNVINVTKGGAAASASVSSSLVKYRVRYVRGRNTDLNANA